MKHRLHAEKHLRDRRGRDRRRNCPHEHERREIFRKLLQTKNHACQWRVKGRCQPRARTCREQIPTLHPRTVSEPADALPHTGPQLHAGALTPQRKPGTDTQHRTDEFQHEHPRPVHVHFSRENAFDLWDTRPRGHAVPPYDATEYIAYASEHREPADNGQRIGRQIGIEHRLIVLRQFQQIAEKRNHEPRKHADEIALQEQPQFEMLRLRKDTHSLRDAFSHYISSLYMKKAPHPADAAPRKMCLFSRKRQQRDVACAFDSDGHLALMLSAVTGDTTR